MTPISKLYSSLTIVSEGICFIEEAVQAGAYTKDGGMMREDLNRSINKLRRTAERLETLRAQLVDNAGPVNQVVHLQAAE